MTCGRISCFFLQRVLKGAGNDGVSTCCRCITVKLVGGNSRKGERSLHCDKMEILASRKVYYEQLRVIEERNVRFLYTEIFVKAMWCLELKWWRKISIFWIWYMPGFQLRFFSYSSSSDFCPLDEAFIDKYLILLMGVGNPQHHPHFFHL